MRVCVCVCVCVHEFEIHKPCLPRTCLPSIMTTLRPSMLSLRTRLVWYIDTDIDIDIGILEINDVCFTT